MNTRTVSAIPGTALFLDTDDIIVPNNPAGENCR
jgi:hypothetical protein